MAPPLRVAVTLEQCWHRVPGGVASTALEAVRALSARGEVDLVGVSALHRKPPPPPWTPSI
ncbi:MAG: glycosyltransferase family 4 protein, partial [Acidimicrobiales bacterium]